MRSIVFLLLLGAMARAEILVGTGTSEDRRFGVFHSRGVYPEDTYLRQPFSYSYTATWDVEAGTITVPAYEITLPEMGATLQKAWDVTERTLIDPGTPGYCDFFDCYPGTPPVYEEITRRVEWALEGQYPTSTFVVPEAIFDVKAIWPDSLSVSKRGFGSRLHDHRVEFEWDEEFIEDGETRTGHGAHGMNARFRLNMGFGIERDESGKVVKLLPRTGDQYLGTGPIGRLEDGESDRFITTTVGGGSVVIVPEPSSFLYGGLVAGVICFVRFAHGACRSCSVNLDEE